MSWPDLQDYNEALQNPRFCLSDSELKMGMPELTALGLPRAISGSFASVYKIKCTNTSWAVRCFLNDFQDQQQRYTAISTHLEKVALLYTVGFSFQKAGIKVRGKWYPILKMEWVPGEALHTYIRKILYNPSALLKLAKKWLDMITCLQSVSVAHGDLQHSNILVVGDELRLVDYDGMYVPGLSGLTSHEVGHRNYQHPQRTQFDYYAQIDNFSAWVIYISIIALSIDPKLWDRFGGGDETLLFRQDDFAHPDSSKIIDSLKRLSDNRVQSLISLFSTILYMNPQQIPSLSGQDTVHQPMNQAQGLPDWARDHSTPTKGKGGSGSFSAHTGIAAASKEPNPSWLIDFIQPTDQLRIDEVFQNSVFPERMGLTASIVLLGMLSLISSVQPAAIQLPLMAVGALCLVATNLAFFHYRFSLEPYRAERNELQGKLNDIELQIKAINKDIKRHEDTKKSIYKNHDYEEKKLAQAQKVLRDQENTELGLCQKQLQQRITSLNTRRQSINQAEAAELRGVANTQSLRLRDIDSELTNMSGTESSELATSLANKQTQHTLGYLRRFEIDASIIPGIGEKYAERLLKSGIRTAADINFYGVQRIQGIGPTRASALLGWRKQKEREAEHNKPMILSADEKNAIASKYNRRRSDLIQEKNGIQQGNSYRERAIRDKFQAQRNSIGTEEHDIRNVCSNDERNIRHKFSARHQSIGEARRHIDSALKRDVANIDDKITACRKSYPQWLFQQEKSKRQLIPYNSITYKNYFLRVIGKIKLA